MIIHGARVSRFEYTAKFTQIKSAIQPSYQSSTFPAVVQPEPLFGAVANLCFNTFGVVLFLPFLGRFAVKVTEFAGDPGMAVAWAQLVFNIVMMLAVLVLLRIFQAKLFGPATGGR